MAHEIFGNRFASFRMPAWHKLGTVYQEPVTAAAAYSAMGEITVESMPLQIPGMPEIVIGDRAIIRRPTADDPNTALLGIVGPEYNLITPADTVRLWDDNVGKTIETLGILRNGAWMFITAELPTLDVKGDEVRNYFMFINAMDGTRSATLQNSPVRTVCMNTLVAAEQAATEVYRLPHSADVQERLGRWMRELVSKAERNSAVLRDAFNILAAASPASKQVQDVLAHAYPVPSKPRAAAADSEQQARVERWEAQVKRHNARRDAIKDLFEGSMTGYEVPAAKGTYWGLYNAVVEAEDYRRGGRSEENVAYEAMFGERAERKERAFERCMVLAQAPKK